MKIALYVYIYIYCNSLILSKVMFDRYEIWIDFGQDFAYDHRKSPRKKLLLSAVMFHTVPTPVFHFDGMYQLRFQETTFTSAITAV